MLHRTHHRLSADTLAALVGFGIDYTGDMSNPSGRGAIVRTWSSKNGAGPQWADITLEDGRRINGFSVCLMGTPEQRNGCAVRVIVTGPVHGAPYLAKLEAAATLREANEKAAADLAQQAHAATIDRLAAGYPYLQRGTGSKTAAANLRHLLRTAWPKVKFSVRVDSRGGDSMRIEWTDGPTSEDVESIADRFEVGHFDGMDDCYHYTRTAWCELFGGVKYVFTTRHLSEEFVELVIAAAANEYGPKDRPTPAEWRSGRADGMTPMDDGEARFGHWSWQSIIHRTASGMAVE